MQVRNKITGATEHVSNGDRTVHALIKLGFLEIISSEPAPGDSIVTERGIFPPMQPAVAPTWSVGLAIKHRFDGQLIPKLMFDGAGYCEHYSGDPSQAQVCFGKRPIPADVLADYRELYKSFWKNHRDPNSEAALMLAQDDRIRKGGRF